MPAQPGAQRRTEKRKKKRAQAQALARGTFPSAHGDELDFDDEALGETFGFGPQLAEYIAPLLDSGAEVDEAVNFGMVCWNFALLPAAEREAQITDFLAGLEGTEEKAARFREVVEMMAQRHRVMFPEMHTERAAELGA